MSAETIHDMSTDDLRRLNSATQYPSIPTFHALGERGQLTELRNVHFDDVDPAGVTVTEKIDGTNARIIIPPRNVGAPLVGSRTELLHYVGDVIANPAQGIVDAVAFEASGMQHSLYELDTLIVVFGEVYGGKASSGSKNYSTVGAVGFRIFDVARIDLGVLDWDAARISSWRESGGQDFADVDELRTAAASVDVETVPALDVSAPPVAVADTHEWLSKAIDETRARLDDTGKGRPEGVVVRTVDRSHIAKVRFEDYERTAKAAKR